MPVPAVAFGHCAAGVAEALPGTPVAQLVEGAREGCHVLGISHHDASVVEQLGAAVGCAGDDRRTRGGRLQTDVGEGVVAGREQQGVGVAVEGRDVAPGPDELHTLGNAEASGFALPGPRGVPTGHEQDGVGVARRGEGAQRRVEALSVPARAREEPGPPSISSRAGGVGVEARRVDPIAYDVQPRARDPEALDDLIAHQLRAALDRLTLVAEDAPLDAEQQAMPRCQLAECSGEAAVCAVEIVGMAAASRAIEVLVTGAAEGVHYVEVFAGCGSCRFAGEGGYAQRLPGAGDANAPERDGGGLVSFPRHDVNLVTRPGEAVGYLPGDGLHPAARGLEALDDEGDAHDGEAEGNRGGLIGEPAREQPCVHPASSVYSRHSPKALWIRVPAIEVAKLSKRFGSLLAVDDVSFSVAPGEVVGFLGPNGAGKTTTMRMLTGFLPPSEGSIRIDGHDSFRNALAARQAVGYLPETPPLYPEMRVASYLRYVAAIKGVPRAGRRQAVVSAVERCGLSEVAGRVISTLSKGYRQRIGLAQAIVHEPPVLVLDEPSVGLDPIQIREIRGLIGQLTAPDSGGQRRTVILSTHILSEVEAICDRVILIDRGVLAVDESLAALTEGGRRLEEVFAQVIAGDRPARAASGDPGAAASGDEVSA